MTSFKKRSLSRKIVFVLLVLFLFTVAGCEKEKTLCGCGKQNPIENIDWLNWVINYYESDTTHTWDEVNLYMYDYKNSNAFIFETKKTGIYDVPVSILNCEGRTIFICGGLQPPQLDSCNVFYKSATNQRLIWKKSC